MHCMIKCISYIKQQLEKCDHKQTETMTCKPFITLFTIMQHIEHNPQDVKCLHETPFRLKLQL